MGQGFDLMKLIREAGKMQEKVSSQQQKLATQYYEAEAGGGMVRAKVNGIMEVVSLHVEKEALEGLGIDSVLELLAGAINEAMKKARESVKGNMMDMLQDMTGGILNDKGNENE